MKALVHHAGARGMLTLENRDEPRPRSGEVLLRVLACGVCRTDLHIVDDELPPHHDSIVPGHQIVGEIVPSGERVGVSWLGGVDGTCRFCRSNSENLCDAPVFTGYDRDGGYAEYVTARSDFTYPLPHNLSNERAAPLLCAGIIGFRALRIAGVEPGERVGLYGFGASAHLALQVLRAWRCEVFVATRGAGHREFARSLGAVWTGGATEKPPRELDRAITFAPSGDVVVAALSALRKGGVVAINAIHLDRMPEFDYDHLLWGERQIRSVTNMTRRDAVDFLALAAEQGIRANVTPFALDDGGAAVEALRTDRIDGAAVLFPGIMTA
ncbi:MAG TPA: zinc-dependent alcohol dehydrogenase family protein [Candidatus Baltobacteraceae bacterium]|jgi:propanol-preferring alcohol dehydrogenase|nr:zinc-dependent alcohol dehydrogenase family protein [Candidatus Baltobacteraceae bacterium]